MVSSGTVTGDASNLQQYLSSYSSEMSGLNGSWTGPSYESISSQASAFVSEYNTIVTQLTNFASAISEYEEYINLKATIAQTEADQANASADAKASYDSPLAQMRTDLETRKKNINNYLTAASSPSLTATPVSEPVSSDSNSSSVSNSLSDVPKGLIKSEKSGYIFPLAEGVDAPVTSSLGPRDQPTAGASTNHKGTDIGIPEGTELHALANGVVTNAGRDDAGGFGNWVRIEQDDGNVVIYGHVSDSSFYNVGDRVNAGDVVALSGNEGVSTGPHLHLQIEDSDGNVLNSENIFSDCWPS